MKRLGEIVSIVPVIAKADTLTVEERQEFRKKVRCFRGLTWPLVFNAADDINNSSTHLLTAYPSLGGPILDSRGGKFRY